MKKLLLLFLGCINMDFIMAQTLIQKNELNFNSAPDTQIIIHANHTIHAGPARDAIIQNENGSVTEAPTINDGAHHPALKTDKSNLVETLEISSGFSIYADFTPINQVWWTTFEKLDQQHKGYLVRADFRPYWIMWIASWKYFSIIDTNKDGQISKEEMQKFIDKEEATQRKKFIAAWKRFDTDKDGFISREEARDSTFLDTRFDTTDTNKDGLLSPQEVINAYAKELAGFV